MRTRPDQRFRLVPWLMAACAAVLVPATLSPADDATPAVPAEKHGRIVDAPDNIRRFVPAEDQGVSSLSGIDPVTFDIRQVVERLSPDAIEWYQHVQTLADPFLEGRAPGTHGIEVAADYVEFHFRKAGLSPAFPGIDAKSEGDHGGWSSYRQPFTIAGEGVTIHSTAAALNGQALQADHDFAVLGNSGTGDVTAPVTFVGYGIENGQDNYSSFEPTTDLTGRIALLLRYEPLDDEGKSRWNPRRWSAHASLVPKLLALAKRGAVGVILVNPPGSAVAAGDLESPQNTQFGGDFTIPLVQFSPEAAGRLLAAGEAEGRDLMTLRKLADEATIKCVAMKDAVTVRLAADLKRNRQSTENIGGVVRGAGVLAGQWVVVGAHYDHLGYGHFGSAAGEKGRDRLHPGADDNASGTAGLMILAKRLVQAYARPDAPADRRSILILAFTGEESGLQGSRYFVTHPTFPTSAINLMVNMDMIGRLRGGNVLLTGTGTAEGFSDLLRPTLEASGLTLAISPGGPGPSDHASFYNAGVPVLMFNTGLHEQYHTPDDVASTVNPAGAVQVLDLMEKIITQFVERPDPLTFVLNAQGGGSAPTGARVSLGIMPDYGAEGVVGVPVASVRDGTAAAEAGILAGDVLTSWNGEPLERTRDMNAQLQKHKPGDVVTIGLIRDGKTIEVKATLKPGRAGGPGTRPDRQRQRE